MGYLLFLPFLVQGRGGGLPTVGLALALLFIGGAFGKAVFGGLGERLGVVRTVMVAEAMTASLIVATLFTPLPLTVILQIGRAACRERVCQYVLVSVVAGSLKKKNNQNKQSV